MGDKTKQIKIKMLQQRFDRLEEEYKDICEQLSYEGNAASVKKIERQLKNIEQKMAQIEQEIEELQTAEIPYNSLLKILQPHANLAILSIKRACQACFPLSINQLPNTVEYILQLLHDTPKGNERFAPLHRFVGHLIIDAETPSSLAEELRRWGQKNIKQFDELLNNIPSVCTQENKFADSYLLIQIKPPKKKPTSNHFNVSAWLIPNEQNYNPKMEHGYEALYVSDSLDDTFTFDDMPQIVESLLEQIAQSNQYLNNLTLEFFLPYEQLSYPVDCWIKEEYGYKETIGQKYRVVVRAYERLDRGYRSKYEVQWRKKWGNVKQACQFKCCDKFELPKDNTLERIRPILDEAIGLILTKVPEPTNNGSIFSLLLITATPIALWLRRELTELKNETEENQNQENQNVIDFLECCIPELPESVRKKRLTAPQNEDNHIGHHLSLLWEDPERLTPDAGFFYSIPQSVPSP